jgi:4'-phosphopantetheinyl transferase
VPKRRRDWLLGRWTAKHLLREYLKQASAPPSLDAIVIRADADGSPYATLAGDRLLFSLSISHSGAYAFCALTDEAGATVGADVEMIEPRPLSLAEQFFTAEELAAVLARPESERDAGITLVWSAKEAFLKSIKEGLRVDTRAIGVEIPSSLQDDHIWQPLAVTARAGLVAGEYGAWWRRETGNVLTLGLLLERKG